LRLISLFLDLCLLRLNYCLRFSFCLLLNGLFGLLHFSYFDLSIFGLSSFALLFRFLLLLLGMLLVLTLLVTFFMAFFVTLLMTLLGIALLFLLLLLFLFFLSFSLFRIVTLGITLCQFLGFFVYLLLEIFLFDVAFFLSFGLDRSNSLSLTVRSEDKLVYWIWTCTTVDLINLVVAPPQKLDVVVFL